jgi:hypothetical protein
MGEMIYFVLYEEAILKLKNMAIVLMFFVFCTQLDASEKVLILTYSYNRPEFIEWQFHAFKKFLQDDYEIVVFNDACDVAICHQIEEVCRKLGITCMRVPQRHTSNAPSCRHQDAIMYSMQTSGFHYNGIVCMFDSDMFLIKPFSIIEFLRGYDIAAWGQYRPHNVYYLFPGVVFLDMRTLPNKETMSWAGGTINGSACDTGGNMHYYLKDNPHIRRRTMNSMIFCNKATEEQVESWIPIVESTLWFRSTRKSKWVYDDGENKTNSKGICSTDELSKFGLNETAIRLLKSDLPGSCQFLLDGTFYHYRAASWDFSIDQNKKMLLVRRFIRDIIDA